MAGDLEYLRSAGIKFVTFDVGHTFLFPDYVQLAESMTAYFKRYISAAQVMRADAVVRRRILKQDAKQHSANCPVPSFAFEYWGGLAMVCLKASEADLGQPLYDYCLFLHELHETKCLFNRVANDALCAFDFIRELNIPMAVISNANGKIERDLEILGLAEYFDFVIDSGTVGYAKPDPRIFRCALAAASVEADRALHVGDNPIADAIGAQSAGWHAVLLDGCGTFLGFEQSAPAPVCRSLMQVALALRP